MVEKNYKLQLVVPHYNEEQNLVIRFLDSIKMQQLIDFSEIGVIIVNDGNNNLLDLAVLHKYPYEIQYYTKEWAGPAAARQYGLDKVIADYVMFCDCDDMFYRIDALWEILRAISEKTPDVITSQFMTNYNLGDKKIFSPINNDDIWIHGKIWKMSYLKANSIKWDTNLKICEDATFTRLGLNLTNKILNLPNTTYYWDQRDNSYSKLSVEKGLSAYLDRIISCESLVDKFLELKQMKLAARFTFLQIYECYFELQRYEWTLDTNKEIKEKLEKSISAFIRKYDCLIEELDYMEAASLINILRERYYLQTGRISLERVSFVEWKKYLIATYISPKETY